MASQKAAAGCLPVANRLPARAHVAARRGQRRKFENCLYRLRHRMGAQMIFISKALFVAVCIVIGGIAGFVYEMHLFGRD